MFIAREEDLPDGDRLPAFFGLVLGLVFLALIRVLVAFVGLVLELVFLVLAFLALPAERRRADFSGVVSDVDAAAGFTARCAGPRPSPMLLANWDRRSE